MDNNDIIMLRDCVAFVIDNDTDLEQEDINNLLRINNQLLSQMEVINHV